MILRVDVNGPNKINFSIKFYTFFQFGYVLENGIISVVLKNKL